MLKTRGEQRGDTMLPEFNRLKEWIENTNQLRQSLHLIPEDLHPLIFKLLHSTDMISYENLTLEEELSILKRRYAKLLEEYYKVKWK
jgi:hypothetical protein